MFGAKDVFFFYTIPRQHRPYILFGAKDSVKKFTQFWKTLKILAFQVQNAKMKAGTERDIKNSTEILTLYIAYVHHWPPWSVWMWSHLLMNTDYIFLHVCTIKGLRVSMKIIHWAIVYLISLPTTVWPFNVIQKGVTEKWPSLWKWVRWTQCLSDTESAFSRIDIMPLFTQSNLAKVPC